MEKRFAFTSWLHPDVSYEVLCSPSRYGKSCDITVLVKGEKYIGLRKYLKKHHDADKETLLRVWDEEDFLYREGWINKAGEILAI